MRPAAEWRSVTDRPKVSEQIPEAALAVRSPSLLVVFEFRAGAGARDDRALHKAVWIVDEQLDPRARDAEPGLDCSPPGSSRAERDRVHECVFGVLAMESEPVDLRL